MRGMSVKGQQVSAEQAKAATPLSMAAMAGPAVCVRIVPGVLSRKLGLGCSGSDALAGAQSTGSAILPKAADGVQGAVGVRKCVLRHEGE
jgi:hypothetical protein